MPDFDGPAEFLVALREATITGEYGRTVSATLGALSEVR
jgi:hypothetical protein